MSVEEGRASARGVSAWGVSVQGASAQGGCLPRGDMCIPACNAAAPLPMDRQTPVKT